jgi:protein-tyrosine phosphatase
MKRVLFLCSGNFYRSRFAEAYFNHHAHVEGLPWRAFSRGLIVHVVGGDLSPHTRRALLHRGISLRQTAPNRLPLTRADLESARYVIALKESEHRLWLRGRFPDWEHAVEYWDVHDLDCSTPAQTMAAIEAKVRRFMARLPRK